MVGRMGFRTEITVCCHSIIHCVCQTISHLGEHTHTHTPTHLHLHTHTYTHTQFMMSVVALVVLIVHVFTKPFEKMHINIIEAAILLNLLMVTAAFLDPSNSPVPFEFSTILVVLPYVYAFCYLAYLAGHMIW